MRSLSNHLKVKGFFLPCVLLLVNACGKLSTQEKAKGEEVILRAENDTVQLSVDTVATMTDYKLKLTQEYCKEHYGDDSYRLDTPKMIVIHYTVIPTLSATINLFKQEHLASNRKSIKRFSRLNVGIHYVIDKDGAIYNLLPDSVVARHIIGFNHVSIGIENVAQTKEELTTAQLESNTKLVHFLSKRHPTIKYLIGHDEYNDTSLPHYGLFTSLNKDYQPYDKPDPGTKFMKGLRLKLKQEHGLEFEK